MPSPYELLRVADLIKLAADTAQACSEMHGCGDTARIQAIALRIKAAAEELEEAGQDLRIGSKSRDN